VSSLIDALAHLDGEISAAETAVVRLREMRGTIQALVDRYTAEESIRVPQVHYFETTMPAAVTEPQKVADSATSYTDKVIEVLREHSGTVFGVDDVVKSLQDKGSQLDRDRVRNSLNYAVKLGKVNRGARRGSYYFGKPIDTSTPVAPGVDVNGESESEGSPRERGEYRDEPSIPPHDQAGSADPARFSPDRTGGRAPIGG
jgi:hypothetical protein